MFYCSHWFCSVDVSPRGYLVAAGRNHGCSETYVCDLMFYCSHWFCSVDMSPRRYLVAAGRNHGIVRLTSVI